MNLEKTVDQLTPIKWAKRADKHVNNMLTNA